MTTVNLEHLAGRRVLSIHGKSIGRIEEIRAEEQGADLFVSEFHVGIFAAFERLSASTIGIAILDVLRLRRGEIYRIPWNRLDISDPARPRLLCTNEELCRMKAKVADVDRAG